MSGGEPLFFVGPTCPVALANARGDHDPALWAPDWKQSDEICQDAEEGSSVWLVKCRKSGVQAVAKSYIKEKLSRRMGKQIVREAELQLRVDHPACLPLWAIYEDDERVYLLSAPMEGDLEDVLHEKGPRLPEKLVAAKIAFPILQALDYLHNMHGIIHRDVKPGNILYDKGDVFVLSDFGYAICKQESPPRTVLGSRPYMAPELLDIVVNNRTEYSFYAGALYDEKVDIWALGVTIYQLLYGQMPFRGKNEADILEAIREDDPVHHARFRGKVSREATNFLARCFEPNPKMRPSAFSLLEDPFILQFTWRAQSQSQVGAPPAPLSRQASRTGINLGGASPAPLSRQTSRTGAQFAASVQQGVQAGLARSTSQARLSGVGAPPVAAGQPGLARTTSQARLSGVGAPPSSTVPGTLSRQGSMTGAAMSGRLNASRAPSSTGPAPMMVLDSSGNPMGAMMVTPVMMPVMGPNGQVSMQPHFPMHLAHANSGSGSSHGAPSPLVSQGSGPMVMVQNPNGGWSVQSPMMVNSQGMPVPMMAMGSVPGAGQRQVASKSGLNVMTQGSGGISSQGSGGSFPSPPYAAPGMAGPGHAAAPAGPRLSRAALLRGESFAAKPGPGGKLGLRAIDSFNAAGMKAMQLQAMLGLTDDKGGAEDEDEGGEVSLDQLAISIQAEQRQVRLRWGTAHADSGDAGELASAAANAKAAAKAGGVEAEEPASSAAPASRRPQLVKVMSRQKSAPQGIMAPLLQMSLLNTALEEDHDGELRALAEKTPKPGMAPTPSFRGSAVPVDQQVQSVDVQQSLRSPAFGRVNSIQAARGVLVGRGAKSFTTQKPPQLATIFSQKVHDDYEDSFLPGRRRRRSSVVQSGVSSEAPAILGGVHEETEEERILRKRVEDIDIKKEAAAAKKNKKMNVDDMVPAEPSKGGNGRTEEGVGMGNGSGGKGAQGAAAPATKRKGGFCCFGGSVADD